MPRNAISVGLVLLAVLAVYWPDTAALGRYWQDQGVINAHGVLVAALSCYLLFRPGGRLGRISARPALWGSLPLIVSAAASLIGWRAGILTVQLFFLPIILWLALLSMLGWQVARSAAFAIGFLYFALPGWPLLQVPLQWLTVWGVGIVGPIVGLPVTMSGATALLPGGIEYEIEPACSGVGFLIVGLTVATLYGELEQARLRRRVMLVGGMLLLAIATNWVRVILIFAIGYLSHMQSVFATRGHEALGWVVFACALLMFVWAAGRLGAIEPDRAVPGSIVGKPDTTTTAHPGGVAWRYGVAAIALLAVPALVYTRSLTTSAYAPTLTFELPPARGLWQGPAALADPVWRPRFLGAQVERRARYESPDARSVEVAAIGFPRQTRGAHILDETNSLLGDRGLSIEAVSLVGAAEIPHSEVVALDPQGRRSVVWLVVDIGGRLFDEPLSSQLWYGARSLIGAPYATVFALRTQCDSSCDAARAALTDFMRANGTALLASSPHPGVAG